jgi:hypothetical protein
MEIDERTSFIGPAGVMAMACTHRRPDATREAPAVIAVGINWRLARVRPGCVGGVEVRSSEEARGNAGGGKRPKLKTDAKSDEGPRD